MLRRAVAVPAILFAAAGFVGAVADPAGIVDVGPGDSSAAYIRAAEAAAGARHPKWVPVDTASDGLLLWFDRDQSPAVGAGNLLFAYGALGRIEDRLLPTRLFEEERFLGRTLSAAYRLTKLLLLDLPAASYVPVIQHEVFGHGWRAREAEYADIGYDLPPPPPYGPGGGTTSFDYRDTLLPGPDRLSAMSMAGIEATDILAQRQRQGFLRDGTLEIHGALLYLGASLGLANYVAATPEGEDDLSNDIAFWLAITNQKANLQGSGVDSPQPWVTLSDLESRSLVSLADPFLWYSAWVSLRYVWNGATRWRYPAIRLGPAACLPSLGYRLSPFGGQYLAEALVAAGRRAATLRAAWGGGELGSSWGADLEAQGLAKWRGFSLDAALRTWSQPALWLDPRDMQPSEASRFGAGMSATAVSPALFRGFPLRLAAGFSAKHSGYVPGESLEADFALRAGIGLYR